MLAGQSLAGMPRDLSPQADDITGMQQGGPDISLLSPRVQRLWDHAGNPHFGNIVTKPYSHLMVHWICTKCPDGHLHAWKARIDNVTQNRGCPLCSGHDVCPHNSLPRNAPHLVPEWDTAKRILAHHMSIRARVIIAPTGYVQKVISGKLKYMPVSKARLAALCVSKLDPDRGSRP